MNRSLLMVVVLLAASGCELLGGGGGGVGGGGGGGGGTDAFQFQKGFTYVRKDDRNVYLADESDFSTVTTLTQSANVRTPSFSADGARIVFVRGMGASTELAVVPTAGGTIQTVLAATAQATNFRTPVFSPDGQRIAFAYDEGSVSVIGLVGADGTGFQKLIGGSSLAYAAPSWTSDGSAVYAAAGSPGLAYRQIERISVSTAQPVSLTNDLGNEALGIVGRLLVSPDDTKLVFDSRVSSGVTRLFVIDVATKTVTKLNEYMGEPNTNDSFPCWMSATTVAFSSDSGGNDNVYRIGVDGTGRELLLPKAVEPFYGVKK